MKTRTIRQTVTFRAAPHDVYEALMDARTHGRFTGGPARISRRVGGTFSVFEGWATGTNLALVADKKIVQTWRADMKDWPADHNSRVTFTLRRVRGGTRLLFTHAGVPVGVYADIKQGWWDSYWTPLKEMFAVRAG